MEIYKNYFYFLKMIYLFDSRVGPIIIFFIRPITDIYNFINLINLIPNNFNIRSVYLFFRRDQKLKYNNSDMEF